MNFPSTLLFEKYDRYFEKEFSDSLFKHGVVKKLIKKFSSAKEFQIKVVGKSFDGKEIYLIRFGSGEKKILLWSQMHGDEPTATMSIFDLLNFLSTSDEFDNFKKLLKEETTIYFLPMLNPDGAELGTRENSQGIDINRDARKLTTPEGNILNDLVKNLHPQFAFNLHDQSFRYSVGKSRKPAVISLLAPSFNYEREMSKTRETAAKLTVEIFNVLSEFVPGMIARYKDSHEPRSFGDTIQGKGIATILIESGRNFNDPDAALSRKLNFIALLRAFHSIAVNDFEKADLNDYEKIPFNGEEYFDLLLRNVSVPDYRTKVDIGINREIEFEKGERFYASRVEEIGDLKENWGMEEVEATELELVQARVYEKSFQNEKSIAVKDIQDALGKSCLFIPVAETEKHRFTNLPMNLAKGKNPSLKFPVVGQPANFIFEQKGKTKFLILNGFLLHSSKDLEKVKNGMMF